MESSDEKRRCRRYGTTDGTQAFVVVRPQFKKLGALKDVSLCGLGFQYVLMDGQKPLSDKSAPVKIDLFISNNGFYLPKVSCKLAYDRLVENEFSAGCMRFCHCGLEFDEITEEQTNQINYFLAQYTVGSA